MFSIIGIVIKSKKKPTLEWVIFFYGAGEENRTPVASLEGWSFTIKLHPQINYKLIIDL